VPIKPENRARYPANWAEIRANILRRAGNRCESCAVPNHVIVNSRTRVQMTDEAVYPTFSEMCEYRKQGGIRVVLTIAHLDHTPENCDLANLRVMCQRCHLTYDAAARSQSIGERMRELRDRGGSF
jgi:hypothetical protein